MKIAYQGVVLGFFAAFLSFVGCATPLQRAAAGGRVDRVASILNTVPKPPAEDMGQALIAACMKGSDMVVTALLDAGADINFPNYKTGWTPIGAAAAHMHASTVKLLLSRGAQTADSLAVLDNYGWPNGAHLLRTLMASATPQAPTVPVVPAAPPSSDVGVPRYSLAEREHDLAVVVGIETYSDLPRAPYAERDAVAFAAHARALGVPARNIVLLTGSKAGRASIEKYVEQWLPRMVNRDSKVYFYFSGHGAPDVKTGQAYLVPWDGDPNFLETTAFPVKRLYQRLQALKTKQVLVAMDACFSGAGGRSVLASGARPLVTSVDTGGITGGAMTVLTASAANEISGSLDDKEHGAFTYFLLKGLNGESNDFSAAGLLRYLTPRVQDESRRLNREQTPQLLGDGTAQLR